MARGEHHLGLALCLCIALSVSLTSGSDDSVCHQENPCLCHFDDEKTINLAPLVPSDSTVKFLSATKGNLTLYYHGCTDAQFKVQMHIKGNTCTDPLSLCLYNATDETLTNMGKAADSKFGMSYHNPNLYEIAYQAKDSKIVTLITLVCTMDFHENILMVHDFNKTIYQLDLFSPYACKLADHMGLSTGSKLLIMFFIFISLYLIGGSCIAYFLRGARGREIIPNIDFWTKLPGLVRDGTIYVMNGCNARMIPSDTYNQI